MAEKKPSVKEKLLNTQLEPKTVKEMQLDHQVGQIRRGRTISSAVGLAVYICVGIAGIFWAGTVIYYLAFSLGALAMLYLLLKVLR